MHITFRLVPPGRDRSIRLPSANLHLFQSMLYALLPPDEASFLHDDGYKAGGKKLKLFAMSWPAAASMPSFEGEGRKKKLILPAPVRLTVSTPMHNLAMSFIEGALSKGELRVGNNPLFCGRVEVERPNAGWRHHGCEYALPHHMLRNRQTARAFLHYFLQAGRT